MRPYIYNAVAASLLMAMGIGCSSTTVVQEKPDIPEVPEYVKVPHPISFELTSLRAIFHSPMAPHDIQGEFTQNCDSEFQKLTQASTSIEERQKGAVELVSSDPERMHWCFYGKISKLEETLQGDTTWGERQKKVLDTFIYLSPIANAFLDVYHDSRYLRWATQYYSKISEWVFFRKVNPGPESTLAQIQNASPSSLEPWVPLDPKTAKSDSVFAKYGISMEPTIASGVNPLTQQVRTPASKEVPPESVKPVAEEKKADANTELDEPTPEIAVDPNKPKTGNNDTSIGY